MRTFIAIATLILSVDLWAYGGRPVSDLRFGGHGYFDGDALAASDGNSFLIVGPPDTGSGLPFTTFAQRIADGRPRGPISLIGAWGGAGLFWNGSHYVMAFGGPDRISIGHVSRDGSRLPGSGATIHTQFFPRMLFNGRSALALGFSSDKVYTQALDLAGHPVGTLRVQTWPDAWAYETHFGPTADGFVTVFTGDSETSVVLLHSDGRLRTSAPIVIDGPYLNQYRSNRAVSASDGTDTLILFGAEIDGQRTELKSVVIAADGSVKSKQVLRSELLSAAGGVLEPFGLVWDGSRYVGGFMVAALAPPPVYGPRAKPVLLALARDGTRSGELSALEEQDGLTSVMLSGNERELLLVVTARSTIAVRMVDRVTLNAGPAVPIMTVTPQRGVALEAVAHGYLAAWCEPGERPSVRLSRIDTAGNYLDGEGLIVDSAQSCANVAIDMRGPQGIVVWADAGDIRGRFVSHQGALPPGGAFPIGRGDQAAVRWHRDQYVVLRSDGSLHRDLLTPSGAVVDTRTLAVAGDDGNERTTYRAPHLTVLADAAIAIYATDHADCPPFGGDCTARIMGLRLDSPTAKPFPILGGSSAGVASDGSRALVLAGASARFLSAENPEQPGTAFPVPARGEHALAFDGTDYISATLNPGGSAWKLVTARITRNGAIHDVRTRSGMEWVPSAHAIAASPSLPPLTIYVERRDDYAFEDRAMLLFAHEIGQTPPPPPAPVIGCAAQYDDGTISVSWQPAPNLFGTAVELQLADGMFRLIGVAPGGATSARVPLAGFDSGPVRVRAWNGGGVSLPSALRSPGTPAEVVLRSTLRGCAGVPVTIHATLKGTPPFTVRWSDGLVQSGLASKSLTRDVTLAQDKIFRIVSITDACGTTAVSESIRITVDPAPEVTVQTPAVRILPNQKTTLSVAVPEGMQLAWFEGAPGDTTRPVATATSMFETPPLTHSTSYWVRVSNACGSVDSAPMVVTVGGKRRAARR